MHILLFQMELYLPGVHSLKEKRHILKPLLNDIRNDFNVSAAEVEMHDEWQHAVLACVCVGNMKDALERIERGVTDMIEKHGDIQLVQTNMQWL